MTVTTAVVVLPRRMAVWATRRALARTSLTASGSPARSARPPGSARGPGGRRWSAGPVLGAGYLARRVGSQLQRPPGGRPPGPPAHSPVPGTRLRRTPPRQRIRWLAGRAVRAGRGTGLYAGLAAGAGGQRADWELATAAAASSTRAVVRRCRESPRRRPGGRGRPVSRVCHRARRAPGGSGPGWPPRRAGCWPCRAGSALC